VCRFGIRTHSAHGFDELASLVNRQRNRLFAIHILAGGGGVTARQRVPVIRSGDDDGVDIAPGEQLAIIVVGCAAAISAAGSLGRVGFFDDAPAFLTSSAVHVAHGKNLRILASEQDPQMTPPHQPATDQTDRESLARRRRSVCSAGGGRNDPRRNAGTRGEGRALKKLAARQYAVCDLSVCCALVHWAPVYESFGLGARVCDPQQLGKNALAAAHRAALGKIVVTRFWSAAGSVAPRRFGCA
jgi:hypothetical protein